MQDLLLKPTHKLVKSYYETLGQYEKHSIDHEGSVRSAFQALLRGCGNKVNWTLELEHEFRRRNAVPLRIDGAMIDTFHLPCGYWEAKDQRDNLEREMRAKLEKGYPRNNTIFQAPEKAILYQNGARLGLNEDIRDAANLVELLKKFFAYREPQREEWNEAVAYFEEHIPQIAEGVKEKIDRQRQTNKAFVERFDTFANVCRQAINPNLSDEAIEKMLVQHLMTERIFRRIFDNPDFTRRNVIAVEIEKVIDSMTEKEFSRDAFLKSLDHFYHAIESAAGSTEDYSQKQKFINEVYERFFQGYSPKEADTHGIVYTPQPIVDFMVRSVEDILKKEFGRSLSDKGVHILDPFVGTGNFITRVMKLIEATKLKYKYDSELHCNEIMLLPYYVASMNIEHEYAEKTGEYRPFQGICLVDTFELAERKQTGLFTEENTNRVERQRQSPIFVVIGNPPYNMGQVDESDENKNRKYKGIDEAVRSTYVKASKATLLNKLSDPYVKAIRWASNRIGDEGVVAFVTNNSFIEQIAFDGMRKHLRGDFDSIYLLDLGGNVRKNPKLSGTTHNVFGIQVGVSINFFVKNPGSKGADPARIWYCPVGEFWRKEQKYKFLDDTGDSSRIGWRQVHPDEDENWITEGIEADYKSFIPLTAKGQKSDLQSDFPVVFKLFSLGIVTNRDTYTYSFDKDSLLTVAQRFVGIYNDTVAKAKARKESQPKDLVDFADGRIKWTRQVIASLSDRKSSELSTQDIRISLYRPFTKQFLLFDSFWNEEQYKIPRFLPTLASEEENRLICFSAIGNPNPFQCLMTSHIPNLHLTGDSQCLGFYRYADDGSNRRENITDWALNEFRAHYSDPSITKWDIFHYVYAVLHHPQYRERYAANLKRELPRIPFVGSPTPPTNQPLGGGDKKAQHAAAGGVLGKAGKTPESPGDDISLGRQPGSGTKGGSPGLQAGEEDSAEGASTLPKASAQVAVATGAPKQIFRAFADAGKRLADLHVNYEKQPEHRLERVEKGHLNWRVEKMRLSKDKTTLVYNEFLTLKGIPPETYEYRLGNRSALEWVIDQYQVSTDKRSGITNDPNRADDERYIVRLIGQVITVSLETIKIVNSLPPLEIEPKPKED